MGKTARGKCGGRREQGLSQRRRVGRRGRRGTGETIKEWSVMAVRLYGSITDTHLLNTISRKHYVIVE